jgi:hypothetical protein
LIATHPNWCRSKALRVISRIGENHHMARETRAARPPPLRPQLGSPLAEIRSRVRCNNAAATKWGLNATHPNWCRSKALRVISRIGENHHMARETRAARPPPLRPQLGGRGAEMSAVIEEETAHSAPGVHRHSDRGGNHRTDRGLPGLSIAAGPRTWRGKLVLHGHPRLGLTSGQLKFGSAAPKCGMGNAAPRGGF